MIQENDIVQLKRGVTSISSSGGLRLNGSETYQVHHVNSVGITLLGKNFDGNYAEPINGKFPTVDFEKVRGTGHFYIEVDGRTVYMIDPSIPEYDNKLAYRADIVIRGREVYKDRSGKFKRVLTDSQYRYFQSHIKYKTRTESEKDNKILLLL